MFNDLPQAFEPGRAGAERGEQAVEPFEGGTGSAAQSVPDERLECRRFDVGVASVDGLLVRAVVAQDEATALAPLHPARQPEAGLDAAVG